MLNIFRDFAPKYWAAKLPVVPLQPWDSPSKGAGKAPIITEWSKYSSEMPSEAVQDHWVASYPDANIGLPLGSMSGLCVIDIDTTDEKLIEAIESCLPASPWVRIGQKGMALVYRWQGQRNFKIKNDANESIVEFLGSGNQVVVPPSIHPKTQKPYAANCELFEVLGRIQPAPLDIEERLRLALGEVGVSLGVRGRTAPLDIVPMGERDNQMTRHAGYLARVVLGIDKSAQFPLQEALDHMWTWVDEYVAKVPGDELDPRKGAAKLLEFLARDIEKGRTLPEGWDDGIRDDWAKHPTVEALRLKNARQRWTVTRAREWLAGKVAEDPADTDWIVARVQEIIALVAADEQFTELDARVLVASVLPTLGMPELKKSDLLQTFKQVLKAGLAGSANEWEDQEMLARVVVEELEKAGEIRFNGGQFWQWTGARWAVVERDVVYRQATEIKGSVLMRRHGDYDAIVRICERLLARELVEAEEQGLNFANGFLGMDLVLQDHDPKFGATFTLPFNYIPYEECGGRAPRFHDFLRAAWGNCADFQQRVDMLQEVMAASMFGLMPQYQRAVLMHGRPSTGKTVLLDIMRALLPPDAVADLPPQNWADRFNMTVLLGKVVNMCKELPENGYIPGNIFKTVIEGGETQGEFKGRDLFFFKPRCAHWFASNWLPASRDSSEGFTRRWLCFGFDNVIREEDKILGLAQMIVVEEREEITSWAVEGLRRLQANGGFTLAPSHLEMQAQLRRVNNSVLAWLESNPKYARTLNPGDGELGMELYDNYVFHVKTVNRGVAVPYERFIQMLYDMGCGTTQARDPLGTLQWRVLGVRKIQ